MYLELRDSNSFKRWVEAINVLVDEAAFAINENGMSLKATDPSNISMVSFSLDSKAFSKFEVEENVKIGVDLDYLNQISKRAKPEDTVVLKLDDKKANLLIEFGGKSARHFKIPLLDISGQDIPALKIDFDVEVECSAELIQDAVKDAALVCSHITVGADSDKLYLKANSSKGQLNTEILRSDLNVLDVKNSAEAMFPLDYLTDIIKTAGFDTLLSISLKVDAPIKVAYKIGDASLTYYLAPRMEPK